MSQISPGGIFVARHRFRPYCTVVAPTLDALLLGLTEHSLDTSGRVNFDDLFINHHQADGDWAVVVNTSPDDDTPCVYEGGQRTYVSRRALSAAASRVAATGIPVHHWM